MLSLVLGRAVIALVVVVVQVLLELPVLLMCCTRARLPVLVDHAAQTELLVVCVAPPADSPPMTTLLGVEDVAAAAYTCSVAGG